MKENDEVKMKQPREYFPLEATHQNKMLSKALKRLKMIKNG